jgi:hypothetical protein
MAARSPREQLGVDLPDPQRPDTYIEPPAPEEEIERPDGLPEKFKDMSEYNNSYRELEDELRRRGDNQSRLEAELSEMRSLILEDRETRQQQQFQGPPQNEQQLREQLQVAYENDPIGTMAYLAQQYAVQTLDQRLSQMQQDNRPVMEAQVNQNNQLMAMTVDRALGDKYQDWGEYKNKVAEAIEADQALLGPEYLSSPEATMRQLERIYENVKAREILQASQNGNFVTNELQGMKQRAQTLSGAGARPGERSDDEEHIARLKAAAQGLSYASWRES